jgi:hypothetical protein
LDRIQAVNLLKEIASEIPDLGPQAMSIIESEPNKLLQTSYTIQFKGLSTECKEQIKTILKNRSLEIVDSEVGLAIYTPIHLVFDCFKSCKVDAKVFFRLPASK